MCPFYYIDGPFKGKIIVGNFQPTIAICEAGNERYILGLESIPREQVVYRKYTYAMLVSHQEQRHIAYIDIAAINPPEQLTEEILPYITIEPRSQDSVPLYIKDWVFKNIDKMTTVTIDGRLRPYSPSSPSAPPGGSLVGASNKGKV